MLVLACNAAAAALPGVTELKSAPERISDAALDALLRAHVAPAEVVAIGESVHGSAGFLKIQTRLIQYLVTQHGFRLLVWENPTLRSLELSRWVAACTKTQSPPPVDVLYMPTVADVPLWEWICEFNRAHPQSPIVFRGMDVWDRPWEHYARVRSAPRVAANAAWLGDLAACPAYAASSWDEVEGVFGELARDKQFLPVAAFARCRAVLSAILDAAGAAGRSAPAADAAERDDAFELALSASTLLGWLGFYHDVWADDIASWNARDRAQARNLLLLMEKHRAPRAILSAHTSHTSYGRSPTNWWGYGDLKSGVHFLAATSRMRIFNIALTAYSAGGTQAPQWSLPTAQSSLDRALHAAGHELAFFTSGAAFLKAHERWWMQNGNTPGPFESGIEIVPADHFDAFFFFAQSHLDKALPPRPIWQP